MLLTVKEAAQLLGVSEKTVYRWIGDRKLPGYRLSGQYRFNRAEILEWATAQKLNISPAIFAEEDPGPEALPALAESLQAGGIFYRVAGADRESALRGVVEVLRLPDEVDRDFLAQMLLARENMASTGMGDGIAIPHTRSPIVLHVTKPLVTLCFLEKPVDFGALDGRPVHALFTLVSPTVRSHLHLLSRLAFVLRDEDFKSVIRREAGREEIFNEVMRLEQAMAKAGSAKATGKKKGAQ